MGCTASSDATKSGGHHTSVLPTVVHVKASESSLGSESPVSQCPPSLSGSVKGQSIHDVRKVMRSVLRAHNAHTHTDRKSSAASMCEYGSSAAHHGSEMSGYARRQSDPTVTGHKISGDGLWTGSHSGGQLYDEATPPPPKHRPPIPAADAVSTMTVKQILGSPFLGKSLVRWLVSQGQSSTNTTSTTSTSTSKPSEADCAFLTDLAHLQALVDVVKELQDDVAPTLQTTPLSPLSRQGSLRRGTSHVKLASAVAMSAVGGGDKDGAVRQPSLVRGNSGRSVSSHMSGFGAGTGLKRSNTFRIQQVIDQMTTPVDAAGITPASSSPIITVRAVAMAMAQWYLSPSAALSLSLPASITSPILSKAKAGTLAPSDFARAEDAVMERFTSPLMRTFKKSVLDSWTGPPQPTDEERATVVVIGGGVCGTLVAARLEKDIRFKTVLIDRKQYYEHTPGVIGSMVDTPTDTMTGKAGVPSSSDGSSHHYPGSRHSTRADRKQPLWQSLKDMLKNTEVVCGKVRGVTEESVTVGYRTICYDYLVIATGSRSASDLKPSEVTMAARLATLDRERSTLKHNAVTVAVVGGGPSGVEMATAIKSKYPAKDVVLISRSLTLLPRVKAAGLHDKIMKRMETLGVEVLLGESVVDWEEGMKVLRTTSGSVVRADRVLWCTGQTPNTDFLRPDFEEMLDPRGYIKVVRTLQVVGYNNVFAGGDCCLRYVFEEKCIEAARSHARVIAANIVGIAEGRSTTEHAVKNGLVRAPLLLGDSKGVLINGDTFKPCSVAREKAKVLGLVAADRRATAVPVVHSSESVEESSSSSSSSSKSSSRSSRSSSSSAASPMAAAAGGAGLNPGSGSPRAG